MASTEAVPIVLIINPVYISFMVNLGSILFWGRPTDFSTDQADAAVGRIDAAELTRCHTVDELLTLQVATAVCAGGQYTLVQFGHVAYLELTLHRPSLLVVQR